VREFQNIDLDTMARKLEVVRGGCRGGVICINCLHLIGLRIIRAKGRSYCEASSMSCCELEDEPQWVQLQSPQIKWVPVLLLIPYSSRYE